MICRMSSARISPSPATGTTVRRKAIVRLAVQLAKKTQRLVRQRTWGKPDSGGNDELSSGGSGTPKIGAASNVRGTPSPANLLHRRVGPSRNTVWHRANLFGVTCAELISGRLPENAGGSRTVVGSPATEWALAGDRRVCGGREFLGNSNGGQYADDPRSVFRDTRGFSPRIGSLPATRNFVACPFEISLLRPASSVRPDEVRLAVGSRNDELGRANVDGADRTGARKEAGTGPRQ